MEKYKLVKPVEFMPLETLIKNLKALRNQAAPASASASGVAKDS